MFKAENVKQSDQNQTRCLTDIVSEMHVMGLRSSWRPVDNEGLFLVGAGGGMLRVERASEHVYPAELVLLSRSCIVPFSFLKIQENSSPSNLQETSAVQLCSPPVLFLGCIAWPSVEFHQLHSCLLWNLMHETLGRCFQNGNCFCLLA